MSTALFLLQLARRRFGTCIEQTPRGSGHKNTTAPPTNNSLASIKHRLAEDREHISVVALKSGPFPRLKLSPKHNDTPTGKRQDTLTPSERT